MSGIIVLIKKISREISLLSNGTRFYPDRTMIQDKNWDFVSISDRLES